MPSSGVCRRILDARNMHGSSGTITNPDQISKQDYQQLKQLCINQRALYIDEEFPPAPRSIGQGLLNDTDLSRVEWLRPAEIARYPAFIIDGLSRFDFGQGRVGNCWFLASIGALTFQKHILSQVVPSHQEFTENYCGIFHFRFWRFGRWVDVVIDDLLPTINRKLIFVHSKDLNEFWPALLEKAYAKVCGSYSDMKAGTPEEAMMDFTGGTHVSIEVSHPSSNTWQLMCRAANLKALMGCTTHQGKTSDNTILPNGLVQGHAYTVTGVTQLMSQGKPVFLVRLWNPWGGVEWCGDWSDRSPLWNTVNCVDRNTCNSVANDGEFWMTLEDFCKFFKDLDICSLSPDFLDGSSSCHWKTFRYEGWWVAGTTAGGCMTNRGSFWTNPQYRVKIFGEHSENSSEKNTLVCLMQKPDKRNRRLVQRFCIGLSIFKVTEQYKQQTGKFPASFFQTKPVAQTKLYLPEREVMEFLMLQPGEYLIVPTTFNPNEAGSFLLTIHSKEELHCYETSGDHKHEKVEKQVKQIKNTQEDNNNNKQFFHQYADKCEEVDAEQLQKLLNENILRGDLKSGGFTIDACRSMVAMMDSSITGKLNSEEFARLCKKINRYKSIFSRTDVSQTGTLSLSELRNAFTASGMSVSDDTLNLMALRYSVSSGHVTLENFISLILRLECMCKIFKELGDGKSMTLGKSAWITISMYT